MMSKVKLEKLITTNLLLYASPKTLIYSKYQNIANYKNVITDL